MTSPPVHHAFILNNYGATREALVKRGYSYLKPRNRARLAGISSIARQKQFILARYLLSACLRQLTGRQYNIETDGSGETTGQPIIPNSKLCCSISHSGQCISVAVSQYGPIGIDVETHRPRNIDAIVSEYFHPEEIIAFQTLESQRRNRWFYRHWTRKEAMAKLHGNGMSRAMLLQRNNASQFTTHYLSSKNIAVSCVHQSPVPILPYRAELLAAEPWIQLEPLLWRSTEEIETSII